MNAKNDTNELEILVRDTFADGHLTETVLRSDEEYAHVKKLTSGRDKPRALTTTRLSQRFENAPRTWGMAPE